MRNAKGDECARVSSGFICASVICFHGWSNPGFMVVILYPPCVASLLTLVQKMRVSPLLHAVVFSSVKIPLFQTDRPEALVFGLAEKKYISFGS